VSSAAESSAATENSKKSAGVRDGMEALAFGGTETPPNRAGEEESGVQALLTAPARLFPLNPGSIWNA